MPKEDKELTPEKLKVSKHAFYFETPLYEQVSFSDFEDYDELYENTVDAFSPVNNYDTTYSITKKGMAENNYTTPGYESFFKIKLVDKRKGGSDILRFFIGEGEDFVVKVGQYPSLADLQFSEIGKKYKNSLSREDMKAFKKAIGLAAHGVGAGSFVYLRRIFEDLIHEAYASNKTTLGLENVEFYKLRMEEKVELLKDFLPSQLVGMKKIYGILSKGVHELSEEDCLAYFPALKLSIELVLEQKIEEIAKQNRDKEALAKIAEIQSRINK